MTEDKPLPFGVLLIAALHVVVPLWLVVKVASSGVGPLFWGIVLLSIAAGVGLFLRQLWAWGLVLVLYVGNIIVAGRDSHWLWMIVPVLFIVYLVLPGVRSVFFKQPAR